MEAAVKYPSLPLPAPNPPSAPPPPSTDDPTPDPAGTTAQVAAPLPPAPAVAVPLPVPPSPPATAAAGVFPHDLPQLPPAATHAVSGAAIIPAALLAPHIDPAASVCKRCGVVFRLFRPAVCICCGGPSCNECSVPARHSVIPGSGPLAKTARICLGCEAHWRQGHVLCVQRYLRVLSNVAAPADTRFEALPKAVVTALLGLADCVEHAAACAYNLTVAPALITTPSRPIKSDGVSAHVRGVSAVPPPSASLAATAAAAAAAASADALATLHRVVEVMQAIDDHGGAIVLCRLVATVLKLPLPQPDLAGIVSADQPLRGVAYVAAALATPVDAVLDGGMAGATAASAVVGHRCDIALVDDGASAGRHGGGVVATPSASPRLRMPASAFDGMTTDPRSSVLAAKIAASRILNGLTALIARLPLLRSALDAMGEADAVTAAAGASRGRCASDESGGRMHADGDDVSVGNSSTASSGVLGGLAAAAAAAAATRHPPTGGGSGATSAILATVAAQFAASPRWSLTHTMTGVAASGVLASAREVLAAVCSWRPESAAAGGKAGPGEMRAALADAGIACLTLHVTRAVHAILAMFDLHRAAQRGAAAAAPTPAAGAAADAGGGEPAGRGRAGSETVEALSGAVLCAPSKEEMAHIKLQHAALREGLFMTLVRTIAGLMPSHGAAAAAATRSPAQSAAVMEWADDRRRLPLRDVAVRHALAALTVLQPAAFVANASALTRGARAFDAVVLLTVAALCNEHGAEAPALLAALRDAAQAVASSPLAAAAFALFGNILDAAQALTLPITRLPLPHPYTTAAAAPGSEAAPLREEAREAVARVIAAVLSAPVPSPLPSSAPAHFSRRNAGAPSALLNGSGAEDDGDPRGRAKMEPDGRSGESEGTVELGSADGDDTLTALLRQVHHDVRRRLAPATLPLCLRMLRASLLTSDCSSGQAAAWWQAFVTGALAAAATGPHAGAAGAGVSTSHSPALAAASTLDAASVAAIVDVFASAITRCGSSPPFVRLVVRAGLPRIAADAVQRYLESDPLWRRDNVEPLLTAATTCLQALLNEGGGAVAASDVPVMQRLYEGLTRCHGISSIVTTARAAACDVLFAATALAAEQGAAAPAGDHKTVRDALPCLCEAVREGLAAASGERDGGAGSGSAADDDDQLRNRAEALHLVVHDVMTTRNGAPVDPVLSAAILSTAAASVDGVAALLRGGRLMVSQHKLRLWAALVQQLAPLALLPLQAATAAALPDFGDTICAHAERLLQTLAVLRGMAAQPEAPAFGARPAVASPRTIAFGTSALAHRGGGRSPVHNDAARALADELTVSLRELLVVAVRSAAIASTVATAFLAAPQALAPLALAEELAVNVHRLALAARDPKLVVAALAAGAAVAPASSPALLHRLLAVKDAVTITVALGLAVQGPREGSTVAEPGAAAALLVGALAQLCTSSRAAAEAARSAGAASIALKLLASYQPLALAAALSRMAPPAASADLRGAAPVVAVEPLLAPAAAALRVLAVLHTADARGVDGAGERSSLDGPVMSPAAAGAAIADTPRTSATVMTARRFNPRTSSRFGRSGAVAARAGMRSTVQPPPAASADSALSADGGVAAVAPAGEAVCHPVVQSLTAWLDTAGKDAVRRWVAALTAALPVAATSGSGVDATLATALRAFFTATVNAARDDVVAAWGEMAAGSVTMLPLVRCLTAGLAEASSCVSGGGSCESEPVWPAAAAIVSALAAAASPAADGRHLAIVKACLSQTSCRESWLRLVLTLAVAPPTSPAARTMLPPTLELWSCWWQRMASAVVCSGTAATTSGDAAPAPAAAAAEHDWHADTLRDEVCDMLLVDGGGGDGATWLARIVGEVAATAAADSPVSLQALRTALVALAWNADAWAAMEAIERTRPVELTQAPAAAGFGAAAAVATRGDDDDDGEEEELGAQWLARALLAALQQPAGDESTLPQQRRFFVETLAALLCGFVESAEEEVAPGRAPASLLLALALDDCADARAAPTPWNEDPLVTALPPSPTFSLAASAATREAAVSCLEASTARLQRSGSAACETELMLIVACTHLLAGRGCDARCALQVAGALEAAVQTLVTAMQDASGESAAAILGQLATALRLQMAWASMAVAASTAAATTLATAPPPLLPASCIESGSAARSRTSSVSQQSASSESLLGRCLVAVLDARDTPHGSEGEEVDGSGTGGAGGDIGDAAWPSCVITSPAPPLVRAAVAQPRLTLPLAAALDASPVATQLRVATTGRARENSQPLPVASAGMEARKQPHSLSLRAALDLAVALLAPPALASSRGDLRELRVVVALACAQAVMKAAADDEAGSCTCADAAATLTQLAAIGGELPVWLVATFALATQLRFDWGGCHSEVAGAGHSGRTATQLRLEAQCAWRSCGSAVLPAEHRRILRCAAAVMVARIEAGEEA